MKRLAHDWPGLIVIAFAAVMVVCLAEAAIRRLIEVAS